MASDKSYERELEVALEAVREAAALCRSVQQEIGPDVIEKADRSPVTLADFGSQALVCRALYETFPGASIIAEEESGALRDPDAAELLGRLVKHVNRVREYTDASDVLSWIEWGSQGRNPERFWTLDPIDGTKGFLRGDQYAIALALVVDGRVAVAALGCPNLSAQPGGESRDGALFGAVRGRGAFQTSIHADGSRTPIHVSDVRETAGIRFCESVESAHSSHSDSARIAERLGITAAPVRIDSQCKYAVVARGEGDAYLRLPKDAVYREKIWDHAAGALVVQEAGGRVTDIAGADLDFSRGEHLEDNRGVIVTNSFVHDPVVGAIADLGIGRFDA